MDASITILKDHELNNAEQQKLVGGVSQTDYQTRDTAIDGVTVFRRALLDWADCWTETNLNYDEHEVNQEKTYEEHTRKPQRQYDSS